MSHPPTHPSSRKRHPALLIHLNPHPRKSKNASHINTLMESLSPAVGITTTSLHLRARKPWRPWGFAAPLWAGVERIPVGTLAGTVARAGGNAEKETKKKEGKLQKSLYLSRSDFDYFAATCLREGFTRAVVRSDGCVAVAASTASSSSRSGGKVKCHVVITRVGEMPPQGAFGGAGFGFWRESWVGRVLGLGGKGEERQEVGVEVEFPKGDAGERGGWDEKKEEEEEEEEEEMSWV